MNRLCLLLLIFACSASPLSAEEFAPFPQNRVRDFYFRQAEYFLSSGKPLPDVLPQFPGLDGGAFGHWGQNPTENSVDRDINNVDSGNVICSHIKHLGRISHKGVAINLSAKEAATGDTVSAVFDPLKLTFVDSWKGGFVSRGFNRFGVRLARCPDIQLEVREFERRNGRGGGVTQLPCVF